uniref:Uncharacterized protein n=1 Tax=Lepeophtheirus salmonis TaxID=72036 RepID=A0A0K2T165_LEPSM
MFFINCLFLLPLLVLLGEVPSVHPQKPSVMSLSLIKEQISEIMIICEERAKTCLCANGQTLESEYFFPGIFGCSPISCECPNGLTINNLDTIEVEEDLTQEDFGRMMSLGSFMGAWSRIGRMFEGFCDGEAPSSCSCENGGEITIFHKKTSQLISCKPRICQCTNGSAKEVPDTMKYSFLSQMEKICDLKECSCTSKNSSSVLKPPFNSLSAYMDCTPNECACTDGSKKVIPTFPDMENNLIESIEDLSRKRLRIFSNLCDGEAPDFCKCIKRSEVITSFGDKKELRKCYPSSCTCSDGSVKPAPKRRGSFGRIIRDMDLKYGDAEMNKLIKFYRGRYNKDVNQDSKSNRR